jgi:hypothetical protein
MTSAAALAPRRTWTLPAIAVAPAFTLLALARRPLARRSLTRFRIAPLAALAAAIVRSAALASLARSLS